MIDKGVNTFVVDYHGTSIFERRDLSNLINLPTKKSIFFTTQTFPGFEDQTDFPDPWFYETGIFDGKFTSVVGQGASGTVLSGEWFGKKAAFKFIEIGSHKNHRNNVYNLKTLSEKLSEMSSLQEAKGSKLISFYGHYR